MPDASQIPSGRRSDGARTHEAILDVATRLASVIGIEGLTIGRVADEIGVSKSGVYAHFGSKEQLQTETVAAAQRVFKHEVIDVALEVDVGIQRLRALCEAYLSYVERRVFPGGCFFASLLAEMDARTGPIHELVVTGERAWQDGLAEQIREAQRRGELTGDLAPDQLAFEIQACLELSNYHFVLFGDPEVIARGRAAVAAVIERGRSAL